jgi:hypothetical protein
MAHDARTEEEGFEGQNVLHSDCSTDPLKISIRERGHQGQARHKDGSQLLSHSSSPHKHLLEGMGTVGGIPDISAFLSLGWLVRCNV